MSEGTTERVLRLLGLLQERRTWTGPDLAERLGVTDRCVRRDITRLRALGYPVNASQGVGGGYQLGPGTALPPLLLDADEAIATTAALLTAGGTVQGAADASLRTLAKLDQVLPPRLRAEVRAMTQATAMLDGGEVVDGTVLMRLARACRDRVRVRFDYTRADGARSERDVEPSALVAAGRRWYLVAAPHGRTAASAERSEPWRTFRIDRLSGLHVTSWRCGGEPHPDPAAYVQSSVSVSPYRHRVVARVAMEPARLRAAFGPLAGRVEPDERAGWSVLTAGADRLEWVAARLASLDADVEVVEPAALREVAARLSARMARLASGPGAPEAAAGRGADPSAG